MELAQPQCDLQEKWNEVRDFSAPRPRHDQDRVLGKADAPVTIFQYSSLTCPHCAAFIRDILPKITTEWIDTGKANLVFRNFPLDGASLPRARRAGARSRNLQDF